MFEHVQCIYHSWITMELVIAYLKLHLHAMRLKKLKRDILVE